MNNLSYKFDNLGEIDQFLESYDLLKLTQEEMDNLNWPVSIKEVEVIINNLPQQKAPDPDGFTGEFLNI